MDRKSRSYKDLPITAKKLAETLRISADTVKRRARILATEGQIENKIGRDWLFTQQDAKTISLWSRRPGPASKAESDLTRSGKSRRKTRAKNNSQISRKEVDK